mmetsp:Transcript_101518/g.186155  ORF Transcript_101518/g.186155 Transcript_101518/m.186155 type:complete len:102 (-) Transcript_101518:138-443(-)
MDLQVQDWGLPHTSRLHLELLARQPAPEPSLEAGTAAKALVHKVMAEEMEAPTAVAGIVAMELLPATLLAPLAAPALVHNLESAGDGSQPLPGQAPALAHG